MASFFAARQTVPTARSMTRRTSIRTLCGAVLALVVGGCKCEGEHDTSGAAASASGGGESAPSARFAFVTNNSSDFWNIAEKGLRKAEKELGVEVEIFRPVKGETSDQQRFLEDIQKMGFDGVAISPINPDEMTDVLNQAAAKMPVICHDSDAPKSKRVSYVGTNNVLAGKAAGEAALRALKAAGTEQGKVALFVGRMDVQNAVERKQGLEDVLRRNQGLELLPTFVDTTDRDKARKNVDEALSEHPDLVLAVALWSYNGPILAAALRDSKRKKIPTVVAFDEEDEVLQAVQDGLFYATIVQQPFEFGYQSIRLLNEARQANSVPEVYDTGIQTITKSNVSEFWAQLEELKK